MRKSLLVLLLIAAIIPQAFAKKWTVDSNPGNNADFATLQAAADGAADGDTLYVRGSSVSYCNMFIRINLFIFGPGYFLTENPNIQSLLLHAKVRIIEFASNGVTT